MKIDLDVVLLDIKNKPIVNDGKNSMAKEMVIEALLGASLLNDNQSVPRFMLAMQIEKESEHELTSEQITLIIKCLERWASPLVVGRLIEILDPARLK